MSTWAKYSVSFFALVLILTALIFVFGPKENRAAFMSKETPVGQLPSNHELPTHGQATTASGTTSPPAEPVEQRPSSNP